MLFNPYGVYQDLKVIEVLQSCVRAPQDKSSDINKTFLQYKDLSALLIVSLVVVDVHSFLIDI